MLVRQGVAVLRLGHRVAEDGTDLGACRDGTCTVRIRGPVSIPLDPRFDLAGDIRVLSIAGNAVDLAITTAREEDVLIACGPQNSLQTCPTTALDDAGAQSGLALAGELRFAQFTIGVVAVDQDGAILDITPTD